MAEGSSSSTATCSMSSAGYSGEESSVSETSSSVQSLLDNLRSPVPSEFKFNLFKVHNIGIMGNFQKHNG